MKSTMRIGKRGAVLALMLTAGVSQALAGPCNSSVTGNGTAKNNEGLAKSRAKDDWRDRAAQRCGTGYDHWLKSQGKQLTCSRNGKLGNRTWTCAAVSTPVK